MKKTYIYVTLVVFEIALGLAYGFLLQNIVPIDFCFAVAFTIPFTVLFISSKEKQDMITKCIETLILSLFLMLVFIAVFVGGNKLHGDFIAEYDVVVEQINGRGGGEAIFTTPQGDQESVELHDYRLIIFDKKDCVEIGDTIRVREYKGIFNKPFYDIVEETH